MAKTQYDASAAQRVPMQIEHNGLLYDVAFLFKPLNDDLILDYFKEEDGGEVDASEVFFDAHIVGAENIEHEDLNELRAIVAPADKRAAIREGLLAALRKAPPKAHSKLNYRAVAKHKTHTLEAFFDGETVDTAITLDAPDREHLRVHQALLNRAFPVRFGDQQLHDTVSGLFALYEALKSSVRNYANDFVPRHHKLLVIGFHLNGYRAVIQKKSQ